MTWLSLTKDTQSLAVSPQKIPKQIKKQNKRKGNRKHAQKSQNAVAKQIFPMTQMVNANLSNINVSTGGYTYQNPTSTATFFSSGVTNITADPCYAMYFTLNDLPQVSTLTALYDQYKFRRIHVTFSPTVNITGPQNAANSILQNSNQIFVAIDLDDAAVVSPTTSLMKYENCKQYNMWESFTISFVPHVAVAVYAGSFTSYGNETTPWLDCGSPNIQHYGLKWCIPCPQSSSFSINPMSVTVKYDLDFRTIR